MRIAGLVALAFLPRLPCPEVTARPAPVACDVSTLRFVHVIWRHGDRTPSDYLPGDDPLKWPLGYGELTKVGMGQHYRLGQWLRRRYTGFLSDHFLRDEVYIRSSDYNRTLMSAQSNLAGFFPPNKDEEWSEYLKWQPVPVHTIPRETDKQLYEEIYCPAAKAELESIWKSNKAKEVEQKFKDVLKFFSEKSKIPDLQLRNVWILYDNYFCQLSNNVTWPSWLNASMFSDLSKLYNAASRLEYHTEKLRRLRGGVLLEEIISRFWSKKTRAAPKREIFRLLGPRRDDRSDSFHSRVHSSNFFPLYATALMVELHQINGENFVKIFHKNVTDSDEIYEYEIPECRPPCTLRALTDNMTRYFPVDWNAECGIVKSSNPKEEVYLVTVAFLFSTTLLFAFLWVKDKKRKPWRTYRDGSDIEMLLDEKDEYI
ncbi:unnamed protein product [Caenorhabditis auriculariae]|uniref:Uncharacterized protein n=1 Tax=Caenorhabditis auriculariae TaxID=2777116 RepID=A0A8S1GZE0_9PELO|nr:unnamed protein product [Caenorhabditis auriculariae]